MNYSILGNTFGVFKLLNHETCKEQSTTNHQPPTTNHQPPTTNNLIYSLLLVVLSLTSFAQIGIGTTTPDASAALDVSSTTKGFLPPRMTEAQMGAISSPVEGLMVYCLDCNPKGPYFYDGFAFVSTINGGVPSGLLDNEVYSSTGKIWMDRNLGATQVATSSTDADSYGDLYQWGRANDGHENRTSATTATTATSGNPGHGDFITAGSGTDFNWTNFAGEDGLWQAGINDPCPSDYRIPTEAELNGERLNFSSNNAAGAFASPLKLPVSGYRVENSDLEGESEEGLYWSSTVNSEDAFSLYIIESNASIISIFRSFGMSVRCIKD